jgi:hypothetical protein
MVLGGGLCGCLRDEKQEIIVVLGGAGFATVSKSARAGRKVLGRKDDCGTERPARNAENGRNALGIWLKRRGSIRFAAAVREFQERTCFPPEEDGKEGTSLQVHITKSYLVGC